MVRHKIKWNARHIFNYKNSAVGWNRSPRAGWLVMDKLILYVGTIKNTAATIILSIWVVCMVHNSQKNTNVIFLLVAGGHTTEVRNNNVCVIV